MSGATPDLIAGYLAGLDAGLRVPAAEAELIVAEAEDHLRETAAAGLAIGMTELEAQEAAISGFGPVRAVLRAHRRRRVTAGDVAMAAWKLAALLATTVGAGGMAGMGIFTYLLRSGMTPYSYGSVSAAPLVAGAVVAGCLAVAAGYGVQAALRRVRHGPGSGALRHVLGQAASATCAPVPPARMASTGSRR